MSVYAYIEVKPVVETYKETQAQIQRVEISLLEERLFTRFREYCLVDHPQARTYLQERIQALLVDYRTLTGAIYERPPCESFR